MFFQRKSTITPEQAAKRLAAGELVVVDVREPVELRQGAIKGARAIPLGQLDARLAELDPATPVAFVCQSGVRSARATKAAAKAGMDAVNVAGGVTAWSRAGLPLTR